MALSYAAMRPSVRPPVCLMPLAQVHLWPCLLLNTNRKPTLEVESRKATNPSPAARRRFRSIRQVDALSICCCRPTTIGGAYRFVARYLVYFTLHIFLQYAVMPMS